MAIYSGFSHEKWWFPIAMLVHQRVYLVVHSSDGIGSMADCSESKSNQSMCRNLQFFTKKKRTVSFNVAMENNHILYHFIGKSRNINIYIYINKSSIKVYSKWGMFNSYVSQNQRVITKKTSSLMSIITSWKHQPVADIYIYIYPLVMTNIAMV